MNLSSASEMRIFLDWLNGRKSIFELPIGVFQENVSLTMTDIASIVFGTGETVVNLVEKPLGDFVSIVNTRSPTTNILVHDSIRRQGYLSSYEKTLVRLQKVGKFLKRSGFVTAIGGGIFEVKRDIENGEYLNAAREGLTVATQLGVAHSAAGFIGTLAAVSGAAVGGAVVVTGFVLTSGAIVLIGDFSDSQADNVSDAQRYVVKSAEDFAVQFGIEFPDGANVNEKLKIITGKLQDLALFDGGAFEEIANRSAEEKYFLAEGEIEEIDNRTFIERFLDYFESEDPYLKECFSGNVLIGTDSNPKHVAEVQVGDSVLAFARASTGRQNRLDVARVTRTFTNEVDVILDFHGTGVTPGHVYWCGGGRFGGQFAPLIDIIRTDGVIVDT